MFIYSSSRFQLGVLCILARAYGQRAWPAILSWQRHRGHTILTLDEDETIYIQRRHRIKVYRGKWEVMEVSGWSLALWPVRKGRVRSDKISSLERGRGSGLLSSCCQSWSTTNEGYDLSSSILTEIGLMLQYGLGLCSFCLRRNNVTLHASEWAIDPRHVMSRYICSWFDGPAYDQFN